MPNWRKLIQSGSDAELNNLYVTNNISASNISASGDIYAGLTVQNSANVVTYNATTGQFYYTASSGLGGGVAGVASLNDLNGDLTITSSGVISIAESGGNTITVSADLSGYATETYVLDQTSSLSSSLATDIATNASDISNLQNGTNNVISVNGFDEAVTISPGTGITINNSDPDIEISASLNLQQVTDNGNTTTNDVNITGLLYASTSYDDGTHTNVVVYDTASGRFYHTGSYGIGGGSLTGLDKQVVYFEGNNNPVGSNGFTFDYNTDSLYISGVYNGQRYASEGLNILDYKTGVVRLGDIDNDPSSAPLQFFGDAATDYDISSSADVYASGSRIVHLYHSVPKFNALSSVPFVGSNISTGLFKNSVEAYSTFHTSNSGAIITLKIATLSTRIHAAEIDVYIKFRGASSNLAIMGFKASYARMDSGDGLVKLDHYKAYHGDASITGMLGGIQPQTVQSSAQTVDLKLVFSNIPFALQGKDIEIVAKYDSHYIPFS